MNNDNSESSDSINKEEDLTEEDLTEENIIGNLEIEDDSDLVPENIENLKKKIAKSGIYGFYKNKVIKNPLLHPNNLEEAEENEENEEDDEEDEEDDEEVQMIVDEIEEIKIMSPIKNVKKKLVDKYLDGVTTKGISNGSFEFKKIPYNSRKVLSMCDFCGKSYKKDMIVEHNADITCMHCFFWSHYHVERRPEADGVYGPTIVDYIIKCRDEHDMYECTNSYYNGCCFICDHFAGKELLCVNNTHKLFEINEGIDDKVDELLEDDIIIVEL